MRRLVAALCCLAAASTCDALAAKNAGPPRPKNRPKSAAAPRRITSDSVKATGVSLNRQLRMVRAVKSASAPTPGREKRRVSVKKDRPVANATAPARLLYERPTLLVDGYNACMGDARLRDILDAKGLDAAREALVRGCDAVATARNWDAVVAFDAGATPLPEVVTRLSPRLTVVFTAERATADAYLEAAAKDRSGLGDGATIVASDDGLVRLMTSAHGATPIRVAALVDALEGCQKATGAKIAASRQINALGASETDVLSAIADRHGGARARERAIAAADDRREHVALLSATAKGDAKARRALGDRERDMAPGARAAYDSEKRLLGLLDLLKDGWWDA